MTAKFCISRDVHDDQIYHVHAMEKRRHFQQLTGVHWERFEPRHHVATIHADWLEASMNDDEFRRLKEADDSAFPILIDLEIGLVPQEQRA